MSSKPPKIRRKYLFVETEKLPEQTNARVWNFFRGQGIPIFAVVAGLLQGIWCLLAMYKDSKTRKRLLSSWMFELSGSYIRKLAEDATYMHHVLQNDELGADGEGKNKKPSTVVDLPWGCKAIIFPRPSFVVAPKKPSDKEMCFELDPSRRFVVINSATFDWLHGNAVAIPVVDQTTPLPLSIDIFIRISDSNFSKHTLSLVLVAYRTTELNVARTAATAEDPLKSGIYTVQVASTATLNAADIAWRERKTIPHPRKPDSEKGAAATPTPASTETPAGETPSGKAKKPKKQDAAVPSTRRSARSMNRGAASAAAAAAPARRTKSSKKQGRTSSSTRSSTRGASAAIQETPLEANQDPFEDANLSSPPGSSIASAAFAHKFLDSSNTGVQSEVASASASAHGPAPTRKNSLQQAVNAFFQATSSSSFSAATSGVISPEALRLISNSNQNNPGAAAGNGVNNRVPVIVVHPSSASQARIETCSASSLGKRDAPEANSTRKKKNNNNNSDNATKTTTTTSRASSRGVKQQKFQHTSAAASATSSQNTGSPSAPKSPGMVNNHNVNDNNNNNNNSSLVAVPSSPHPHPQSPQVPGGSCFYQNGANRNNETVPSSASTASSAVINLFGDNNDYEFLHHLDQENHTNNHRSNFFNRFNPDDILEMRPNGSVEDSPPSTPLAERSPRDESGFTAEDFVGIEMMADTPQETDEDSLSGEITDKNAWWLQDDFLSTYECFDT